MYPSLQTMKFLHNKHGHLFFNFQAAYPATWKDASSAFRKDEENNQNHQTAIKTLDPFGENCRVFELERECNDFYTIKHEEKSPKGDSHVKKQAPSSTFSNILDRHGGN